MDTKVYLIRSLTNLHPGSGDSSYGVVDKLVQRDPATKFPTIHMSGIKGAMREYFKQKSSADVVDMFGSSPQDDASNVRQGQIRFLSAELLAIPGPDESASQSQGRSPYHLYYDDQIISEFIKKVGYFSSKKLNLVTTEWTADSQKFREFAEDLPVIARNYLDNGESQNLWYEEVVPRESRFGSIFQGPTELLLKFDQVVKDKVIQIGGNATVGYGYCLFTEIPLQ